MHQHLVLRDGMRVEMGALEYHRFIILYLYRYRVVTAAMPWCFVSWNYFGSLCPICVVPGTKILLVRLV
jgi:hypothetical protein